MRIFESMADADQFVRTIAAHKVARGYGCFVTTHSFYEASKSQEVHAAIVGSAFLGLDGAPIVWLANRRSPVRVRRVAGPDFMAMSLAVLSELRGRIGLIGGTDSLLTRLTLEIRSRYPGVTVCGTLDPGQLSLEALDMPATSIGVVNDWKADIIFVSLGAPKQEVWMAHNASKLNTVLFGVGAAFGFLVGDELRAPQLVQRYGAEWIWRLAQNPARLAPRYMNSAKWFCRELLRGNAFTGRNEEELTWPSEDILP